MEAIPRYSTLYSISDLHMGGPPGMRMFRQGGRLGRFLRWLAGPEAGGEPCALVIAGDLIDTLPFMTGKREYIAVDGAAEIVRTIATDFAEVFDGLGEFVRAKNRELIILLGNHDLELAFPEAQAELLNIVAGSDVEARGRVRFATNGTGFRCHVGDKLVYVTHGNEADRWNHVDYEALRRAAHARALGHSFDALRWVPNAGTKLVVEVMNKIKRTRPWVDLLKPETGAMINLLMIFDSARLSHALSAMSPVGRLAREWSGPRVVLGGVSQDDGAWRRDLEDRLAEGRQLASGPSSQDAESGSRLLAHVRELHTKGRHPEELVGAGAETLGYFRLAYDWMRGLPESEAVRRALGDWIADDQTFEIHHEDEQCRDILGQIGPGIDVVITGHTHLPRWLHPGRRQDLVYLNAGTWARLIGIPRDLLSEAHKGEFEEVYRVLRNGSMEKLDSIEITVRGEPRKLVVDVTLAARVSVAGSGETTAELMRITEDDVHLQVAPYLGKDLLEPA